jgi:hypothetical protein
MNLNRREKRLYRFITKIGNPKTLLIREFVSMGKSSKSLTDTNNPVNKSARKRQN